MIVLLASLALAAPKSAPAGPPCLAEAQKVLAEASPGAAGKAWMDLVACDVAAGKAAAPEAWKRIISGAGADAAAVKAIELGLGDNLRAWVDGLQPDEKSAFINTLGEQCAQPPVPGFFVDTQKVLGDKFWGGRWYAGLDACRVPAAVEILKTGLETQAGDRSRFKSILEMLSRNLGKDAIPVLEARAAAEKDPELASYIIGAFADASGVGSVAGLNTDAAQASVAAIVKLAPTLPEKSLEQARTTLLALRDEAQSDAMAAQRYRAVAQADGSLQYGVYVQKLATCKKGDLKAEVHSFLLTNAGRTWPDQVAERAKPAVGAVSWKLPKDCVATPVVMTSPTPVKDAAAFDAWVKEQDQALQKANPGLKVKVFADPAVAI